jgi:hypothetical protein
MKFRRKFLGNRIEIGHNFKMKIYKSKGFEKKSQDNVVGKATGCGLDDRGVGV